MVFSFNAYGYCWFVFQLRWQFLITGIEYNPNLKPFKMMQNSKLRFFDIILCVNGNPIVEGNTSEKSPQEVLDSLLSDQSEVKLTISIQSYSLRTTQDIIAGKLHIRSICMCSILYGSFLYFYQPDYQI